MIGGFAQGASQAPQATSERATDPETQGIRRINARAGQPRSAAESTPRRSEMRRTDRLRYVKYVHRRTAPKGPWSEATLHPKGAWLRVDGDEMNPNKRWLGRSTPPRG